MADIREFMNNWYDKEVEQKKKTKFNTLYNDYSSIARPYLILKSFSAAKTRKELTQLQIDQYVNSFNDVELMRLAEFLLDTKYVFLTHEEIRKSLKHTVVKYKERIGEVIPDFAQRQARFNKIKKSSYKNNIIGTYGLQFNNRSIAQIVNMQPNKFEDFILNFDKQDHAKLANDFGIVIPQYILNMYHRKYILNEILKCYDVITTRQINKIPEFIRSDEIEPFLHKLTTKEILYYTNIGIFYQNREHYLENVVKFINEQSFFIPIRPIRERSVNSETTLCTEIDEESDFICFGDMFSYITYEVDELLSSFQSTDEEGKQIKIPRRPDNIKERFTTDNILNLKYLISEYSLIKEEFAELAKLCDDILLSEMKIANDILNLKIEFNNLSIDDKRTFDNIFTELIKAGMYMRRWLGEGHPYPLSERDTKVDVDPGIRTYPQLGVVSNLLDTLSDKGKAFYRKLPCVDYTSISRATKSHGTILPVIINQVGQGTYCIRMASTPIIMTSFYYKLVFCSSTFAGLNPEDIKFIY